MTRDSLDAAYFDGVFSGDDDPWSLASSDYERAKFDRTVALLADRRYPRALEIGCAHGVLTKRIALLCDDLLAIDIAARAVALARERCRDRPEVRFETMAFPGETLDGAPFDLVLLSEVAYYWSAADLDRAGAWLGRNVRPGGRIMLVHYTGDTDYPQTGDAAVDRLADALAGRTAVAHAERADRYRLDLWERS